MPLFQALLGGSSGLQPADKGVKVNGLLALGFSKSDKGRGLKQPLFLSFRSKAKKSAWNQTPSATDVSNEMNEIAGAVRWKEWETRLCFPCFPPLSSFLSITVTFPLLHLVLESKLLLARVPHSK